MANGPSGEDFARADRLMKERRRNLQQVTTNVKHRFMDICPLHEFFIMWQRDVDFRAYVFFKEDKDVEVCKASGVVQELIDFVYAELERAGRGKRGEIEVAFEFDSHENVIREHKGDYNQRLM